MKTASRRIYAAVKEKVAHAIADALMEQAPAVAEDMEAPKEGEDEEPGKEAQEEDELKAEDEVQEPEARLSNAKAKLLAQAARLAKKGDVDNAALLKSLAKKL